MFFFQIVFGLLCYALSGVLMFPFIVCCGALLHREFSIDTRKNFIIFILSVPLFLGGLFSLIAACILLNISFLPPIRLLEAPSFQTQFQLVVACGCLLTGVFLGFGLIYAARTQMVRANSLPKRMIYTLLTCTPFSAGGILLYLQGVNVSVFVSSLFLFAMVFWLTGRILKGIPTHTQDAQGDMRNEIQPVIGMSVERSLFKDIFDLSVSRSSVPQQPPPPGQLTGNMEEESNFHLPTHEDSVSSHKLDKGR